MADPRKITDGKFDQTKFNDLVNAVNAATVKSGANYLVRRNAGGTVLDIKSGKGGGVHPFKVIDASSGEGPAVRIIYGAVIDFSDWFEPLIYDATIGGESLSDGPTLELPASNSVTVYLKILQGSIGEVDAEEDDAVSIVAVDTLPTVPANVAYLPIAIITTEEVEGVRKITAINQIISSHILWPLKPDFMGWKMNDPADDDSKTAFWLGDQSPYRSAAAKLNDLWIQVRRDEFDNGIDSGDSVFFLGINESSPSYQLALHRSEKRGIYAVINNDSTNLTIDNKNEANAGVQLEGSDDAGKVFIVGKNETASIEAKAGDASSTIEMIGDQGSLKLTAENIAKVELTGEDTGKVTLSAGEMGHISIDGTKVVLSFEDGLKFEESEEEGNSNEAVYDIDSINIKRDGGKLDATAGAIVNITLEGEDGGKVNLAAGEQASLSFENGKVILNVEDGLKFTEGSDTGSYKIDSIEMAGKTFEPHTLTMGEDEFDILSSDDIEVDALPCSMNWDEETNTLLIGDGTTCTISNFKLLADGAAGKITINNTEKPAIVLEYNGGKLSISVNEYGAITIGATEGNQIILSDADLIEDSGDVQLRELDVCHMGAAGKRQFLCGESYAEA